jgi:hypothetical protein
LAARGACAAAGTGGESGCPESLIHCHPDLRYRTTQRTLSSLPTARTETVDFGDGHGMAVCHTGPPYTSLPCLGSTFSHFYNSSGVYTAQLKDTSGLFLASATITVQ